MSWVAVVMSVLTLVGSLGLYGLYTHFNGNIQRINLFGHPITSTKHLSSGNEGAVNFLLVGSDSRAGGNGQLGAGHSYAHQGARTDTMILLHIPAGHAKATLISFPRDSWVNIPGHGMNKLNAAYPLGGPALLVATIQDLSGMRIDHYVQVDFVGFLKMTDALGGVDICLTHPAIDSHTQLNLTAGPHHISGITALAYVRQRYGLPRGDLDRIRRQQTFIGAMIRKVTSAGVLLNPFRLTHFLDVATKALQVDNRLSINDLRKLAERMRHLDPAHVNFETIPVAKINGFRAGQSVVLLDDLALPGFFDAVKNDVGPTPSAAAAAKLTVAPSAIPVTVLNGVGTKGLAHSVANSLSGVGFPITATGSADSYTYSTTVIRYSSAKADSARTLAAAVPGATLQLDESLGSKVVLVVGGNYAGVKAVKVGTSTANPTPSKSPDSVTAADTQCGV